jgi:ATP-binding cassette subfamily F protein 3
MILACQNIEKAFDGVPLLCDASFHIEEREKAALIGINGAGKSTLFRIIVGEITPEEGQVILAKGKTLGYLAQHQDLTSDLSIYDSLLEVKQHILDMEMQMRRTEQEMKHAAGEELTRLMESYSRLTQKFEQENGYAYKSEITGVLKGLGFGEEDFSKMISTLSGGQKTRVALGRLLLSRPDIILLDEPTNHLDMESITWLETYLLNYPGAVFIVSHDRYFLDRVVTKIVEIDNTKVTTFTGNYSAYSEKKAMLRKAAYQAYLNQQQEIKHQEEVIAKLRQFNREKSIRRAESREKMLEKMDVLEKPVEVDASMKITLRPRITSGNDVLTVEHLTKSFPSLPLFEDLNFTVKRGEKVAIIGNNGTGKTTILKILNQLLVPDSGVFHLGSKVHIGYYDQEHHVLHMEKTVFEEISDDYPKLTNTEIRNLLAAFLFTGDDVFKKISALSGGERGRVSLAKLMLSEANFLILDEPTNHLDITSKEILEEALNNYEGTVLYVSHDRYFINRTATRILELTNQKLVNYIGNYDYYLEKKEELTQIYAPAQEATQIVENMSATKLDWQQQKEEQARIRKRQNDLKKTEKAIEELEARDKEIDSQLEDPQIATNSAKCMALSTEKADIALQLEELYEKMGYRDTSWHSSQLLFSVL